MPTSRKGGYPSDEPARPQSNDLQVPPHDQLAEDMVIGAVLRNPDCCHDLVDNVKADHFFSANRRTVWETVEKLYHDGKKVDAVTIAEHLSKRKLLMEIGGAPALIELHTNCLTSANCLEMARIIHEKWMLREVVYAGNEIARLGHDSNRPADEVVAEAETLVMRIMDGQAKSTVKDIRSVVQSAMFKLRDRQSRPGMVEGVLSFSEAMNDLLVSMRPGQLVVGAGRPGQGKSSFLYNMIECVCLDQRAPAALFSLEVPELQLAERLLCMRANVDGYRIRKGMISATEDDQLVAAAAELSNANLWIDDSGFQSANTIATKCRRLKSRHGLAFVGIDYLGLLSSINPRHSSTEHIDETTRKLKSLAMELDVPILLLAQLSRQVEQRDNRRPRLADLRGSGQIEANADSVILLSCADTWDSGAVKGEMIAEIAKNRGGSTGDVTLNFTKATGKIRDVEITGTPFANAYNPDGF